MTTTALKRIVLFFIVSLSALIANAQHQRNASSGGSKLFTNPVFSGDYPDPSLLRDGKDYYMVHSSFEYYPGLQIWHSTDLINWTPVTHALHQYVGSVWAPDLVKYKGKYYIYFPANNTNYVITANAIQGPWSDPVELKINNIDPGHVVDASGKRYLYFNNGGYVPLADDGLSVVGELKASYSGWTIPREWSIECFCMEGPKIVKRGEYYYLTVAEGGTAGPATSHMIISARSKSPLGPWENSPHNPIVRTRNNTDQWCSTGHGTPFEDADGKWWMVYHGYEKGYYTMGRQTLLQPIEWTESGWFKVADNLNPANAISRPMGRTENAPFTLNDSFTGNTLAPQWKFFGEYNTDRFKPTGKGLTVKGKGKSAADCSPLLCIPADHAYVAQVEMFIEGNATGGLVLFYNSSFNSGILADSHNILANLRRWQFATEKGASQNHIYLRLKNVNHTVDMFYSPDGNTWTKIENSLEVSGMHHNVLSGFLSLRLGLCAIGDGSITFRNFTYEALP